MITLKNIAFLFLFLSGILFMQSCEPRVLKRSDEFIINTWILEEYDASRYANIMVPSKVIPPNRFGYVFNMDGTMFVRHNLSDVCLGETLYEDYEGTWEYGDRNRINVYLQFQEEQQGLSQDHYEIEILEISESRMTVKVIY